MGGGCSGLVMNFHDLPIWVMVTYHVLSGFFLFLFLVILEIEGKLCFGWDVWTNHLTMDKMQEGMTKLLFFSSHVLSYSIVRLILCGICLR